MPARRERLCPHRFPIWLVASAEYHHGRRIGYADLPINSRHKVLLHEAGDDVAGYFGIFFQSPSIGGTAFAVSLIRFLKADHETSPRFYSPDSGFACFILLFEYEFDLHSEDYGLLPIVR